MCHETAIFGQKTNPEIPVIICVAFFFSLNNRNIKITETPIFILISNTKKRVSEMKLKTEKNAPFLKEETIFRNCQINGHKQTQNDN